MVGQIENALSKTERRYFSPRISVPSLQARTDGLTDELAQRIFRVNVDVLNARCNMMVAYFGWELPKDRAIFNVGYRKTDDIPIDHAVANPLMITVGFDDQLKGPLNIPDAGTVWEAGHAFASDIPVFGIFGKDQRPNLMLTQSCAATFENVETFETWLSLYDLDPSIPVPTWKGPQQ